MGELEQYQQRAIALMDAFQNHIADITNNDIVGYVEAVDTHTFVDDLKQQLQTLRRDIIFARRNIRVQYNAQILSTNALDRDKLRAEKSTALLPYDQLLLSVDRTLMTIAELSRVLSQILTRFQQVMENRASENTHLAEFNIIDAHIRTVLRGRLDKWKIVHGNLETRLAHIDHNIGEIAYLRGAIKLLEIVIADVEGLVEQEPIIQ